MLRKIKKNLLNKIRFFKNKLVGNQYDFVDFGSKTGGSMELAVKKLGGKRGLGIELRHDAAEEARKMGYDVMVGDATNLNMPSKSVRFTVISHFLEHLPGINAVKLALENAVRISTDFLYIRGPVFDNDEYLKSLGLKVFWSDWKGHPCHLTTRELGKILESLGVKNYNFKFEVKMDDSDNKNIHPLSSPPEQHEYDPVIHPPKKYIKFDKDLYREFICRANLK